jgi:hypothetical protein
MLLLEGTGYQEKSWGVWYDLGEIIIRQLQIDEIDPLPAEIQTVARWDVYLIITTMDISTMCISTSGRLKFTDEL